MAELSNLLSKGQNRFIQPILARDIISSGKVTATDRSSFSGGLDVGNTLIATSISTTNAIVAPSWLNASGVGLTVNGANYITNTSSNGLQLTQPLYLGTNRSFYFNTAGDILANNIVAGNVNATNGNFTNVDVKETLSAYKYELHNIMNLGGEFIVAPTIRFTPRVGSVGSTATIISKSGNNIQITILDTATIQNSAIAGVTWSQNSKIKFSAKLKRPNNAGTITITNVDGTINTTMHTTGFLNRLNIVITVADTAPYVVNEVCDVEEAEVMMYQLYGTSAETGVSKARDVGIRLISYGTNKTSAIDLSTGLQDTPNTRIGLLTGLPAINGRTPSGWGIYTDNGYFNGVVVSNLGNIGGYKISETAIYTGEHSTWNANNEGIYLGSGIGDSTTKYLSFGSGGVTYFTHTGTGKIGAWLVSASSIYRTTNALGTEASANSHIYLGTAGFSIGNKFIYNSDTGNLIVNGSGTFSGTITANDGDIGPWKITSTSIYKGVNTLGTTGNNNIYLGNNGFSLSNKFIFDSLTGNLTVNGSGTFNGTITANDGAIGPWNISTTSIYKVSNLLGTSSSASDHIYLGDSGLSLGPNFIYNASNGNLELKGKVTATDGEFTGKITSTTGIIGPWNITETSIYKGSNMIGSGTKGHIYLGNDGFSLADKLVYRIDGSNNSLTFDGKIISTEGSIGGWTIESNKLSSGTAPNNVIISSAGFSTTILGEILNDMRFTVGNQFGINSEGKAYMGGALIAGDTVITGNTTIEASSIKLRSVGDNQETIEDIDLATTFNRINDGLAETSMLLNEKVDAEAVLNMFNNMIETAVSSGAGKSIMTQTDEGWVFNMSEIDNSLTDITERTAYIHMQTDENGTPYIELGGSENNFKVRITNESIDFMESTEDGDSRIAYMSNQIMFIKRAVIEDELQVGEETGFIWKRRANGNMGLRWV
ncbi:MAG: hypothetical protein PHC62_00315 [Candidatus Izemoplasmatales bacterium]|nr:hypothetical protein [Candidatus Izemoplasmatales bacterium]